MGWGGVGWDGKEWDGMGRGGFRIHFARRREGPRKLEVLNVRGEFLFWSGPSAESEVKTLVVCAVLCRAVPSFRGKLSTYIQ